MKIWLTIATFLFFAAEGEPQMGAFFACIVFGLAWLTAQVLRRA